MLLGNQRMLATLATGSGKTCEAFRICWKLWSSRWNRTGESRRPKTLFRVDEPMARMFAPFGDARDKIAGGDLSHSRDMDFGIDQGLSIAQPEDAGPFGSHRSNPELTTAEWLRYYFLIDDGLLKIRHTSPGEDGHNPRLVLEKLMALEVPPPSLAKQQTCDRLQAEVGALKSRHAAIRQASAALVPATLKRLFAGTC